MSIVGATMQTGGVECGKTRFGGLCWVRSYLPPRCAGLVDYISAPILVHSSLPHTLFRVFCVGRLVLQLQVDYILCPNS